MEATFATILFRGPSFHLRPSQVPLSCASLKASHSGPHLLSNSPHVAEEYVPPSCLHEDSLVHTHSESSPSIWKHPASWQVWASGVIVSNLQDSWATAVDLKSAVDAHGVTLSPPFAIEAASWLKKGRAADSDSQAILA